MGTWNEDINTMSRHIHVYGYRMVLNNTHVVMANGKVMKKKPQKKSAPTKRDIKLDPISPVDFEDALKQVSRKTPDQTRKPNEDSE